MTEIRSIRWIREAVLIIDTRHPELLPPPRVTLFQNGSLQVRSLKPEDTGEYICEIKTIEGELATQYHAIEVQYPPSVVSDPKGIFEVKIGSVFEIVCEANGVPQPIITWKRNGRGESDHLDNTRRTTVEVTSREMSGPIECIATNGVGEPAVAGINMIVLFPPEIKPESAVVHTKINLRASLECHVISAPVATVHWFHHGVPVLQDLRISRHDTDINVNLTVLNYHATTKHVLTIKKVKETDLGMYECRAENKLGFKGAVIELTGRPLPSAFKTSPLASTPMTHNLIWQTESLSQIFEYKLKFRQIPSGNITPMNRHTTIDWNELVIPSELSEGPIHTIGYTLRGLMPASIYDVAVQSRNRYGWSDNSRIIRFATGGEIELPNLSTETIDYEPIDDNYITDMNTPAEYSDYAISKSNVVMGSFSLIGFLLTLKLTVCR
ncbi:protein amalgam isoform X2 [Bradysia coprophila]|uniref:protein amalgam isoform X2 n=1 Tax=Bradysia coprophila TaxID=38358 RepID=UPI00187DCC7B|nr:protein amalgam isoform X2 [Bradysia coprophila]